VDDSGGLDVVRIDDSGWAARARRIDSPNQDDRPRGCAIELVVVHGISLPPGRFGGFHVVELFTNSLQYDIHPYFDQLRGIRVSAHFFVRRDGTLLQFVSCLKRAWHAGESSWHGRFRCNDFSIGVELEGSDELPYEEIQYRISAELISALRLAYPIRDVVGHSDIAPGRKTDPGPHFDWARLSVGRLDLE